MSSPLESQTAINTVLRRARIFFLLFVLLVILSLSSTLYLGIATGELDRRVLQPLDANLRALGTQIVQEMTKVPQPRQAPKSTSATSSTASSNVRVEVNIGQKTDPEKAQPAPPPTAVQPTRECFRYTVPHLDGSTSNLCYSKADYDQLWDLGYELSSAKTFAKFHLESAQRYQDEYDRTGASLYLDAKASSEKQAQRESEKIGPLTLQMQEIEKRGF